MRRPLITAHRALILVLTALALSAWTITPQIGGGIGQFDGGISSGGSAAYVGPGDIVSGAKVWYGLRSYSLATNGTKLVNVCNAADATCVDLSSSPTTGLLVVTTVGGTDCSVATCTIKTWYDKGSLGKNLTQATIASRPVFGLGTAKCDGLQVCAIYAGVPGNISSGSANIAQPFTMSMVAVRTGVATFTSTFGADDSSTTFNYLTFAASSNGIELTATASLINTCCTDDFWHAIVGVANSTSSIITADNATPVIGNVGTASIAVTDNLHLGSDGYAEPCTCQVVEAGIWPTGFTTQQNNSLIANQQAFWSVAYFYGNGASSSISPAFGYGGVNVAGTDWLSWEGYVSAQRVVEVTTTQGSGHFSPSVVAGTNTLTNDPHGQPSVTYDPASGCVYVFYGAHDSDVQISKTTACGSPAAWTASSLSHLTYGNFTFTKPFVVGSTLYLFYETTGIGIGAQETLAVTTASIAADGTLTWSGTSKHLIDVATAGVDGWIFGGTFYQNGTKILMSFAYGTSRGVYPLANIYIAEYDTTNGNVLNVSGSSVVAPASQPVSKSTLDASYKAITSADVEPAVLTVDGSGVIHIAYPDAASGTAILKYSNWSGSSWASPTSLFTYTGITTAANVELAGITNGTTGGVDVYYSDAIFSPPCTSFSTGCGSIWLISRSSGGSFGSALEILAATNFGLDGLTPVQGEVGKMMFNEVSADGLTIPGNLKGYTYSNPAGFVRRPIF